MAVRVDDEGIHLDSAVDGPLDVTVDGHRLWSFHARRDGVPDSPAGTSVTVPWPTPIAERLHGTALVAVRPHSGGDPLYEDTPRFGGSDEPLRFVDDAGHPLSLDKGNRFQRSFDALDERSVSELVSTARRLLDELVDVCDLEVHLGYGGLLGAVRTGHMIGDDSDLDLVYVSRHTHPFDIIRECRTVERRMRARGWRVVRMSAANFKVWVPLPSGTLAGIDVFGSFHIGEHFHVTGSLRGSLDRRDLFPFTTVTLEGITFPAPADLPSYLGFVYGPGWREPDPAFHFDHPAEHTAMMSQWFRGSRARLWHWTSFYQSSDAGRVPQAPSDFVGWVSNRLPPGARLHELGSGTGRDAVALASHGYQVTASDYCHAARSLTRRRIHEAGLRTAVWDTNLESVSSYLTDGARLAHDADPAHLYARLLVDALSTRGRDGLWRLGRLAGRTGGHTFVEFRTAANRKGPFHFGEHVRTLPPVPVVEREIAGHGGRVVSQQVGRGLAVLGEEDPLVCRMEVSWR